MRHVFTCVKKGWEREREGVWFDADMYTKEEAEKQFIPVTKMVEKNGGFYPFTFHEYDGQTYYSVDYMGLYEDDDMPGMV